MTKPIDENAVHKIVNDKVENIRKDLTDNTIATINIGNKVDAMYGNGSGRKGILDRIEASQVRDKEDVKEELRKHNVNVDKRFNLFESTLHEVVEIQKDEIVKQKDFRHEVRNIFETQQAREIEKEKREEEERKEIATKLAKEQEAEIERRRTNKDWIKWAAGGIAVVIWEFSKDQIKAKLHLK